VNAAIPNINDIFFAALIFCIISIPVNAQFGSCDYHDTLEYNKKAAVFSTNYPKFYSPNTACRWTAVSPVGTQIVLSCQDVYMPEVGGLIICTIPINFEFLSDIEPSLHA
jgi:CUB domain